MSDESTTKPTIETVLQKINALGLSLNARVDGLSARVDAMSEQVSGMGGQLNELNGKIERLDERVGRVEEQVAGLRSDVETGLRIVGRKIEVFNDELLAIKANQRDMIVRFEALESKAS